MRVARLPSGAWHALAELQAHRRSVFRHPATGAVRPWRAKAGEDTIEQPLVPALCTNDEIPELEAVLGGRVSAQLAAVTAAPYIRSGRLVPVLGEHTLDRGSYFVYFGSRTSQPARARAFVELAVQRLVDNSEYVLTVKELRGSKRLTRPSWRRPFRQGEQSKWRPIDRLQAIAVLDTSEATRALRRAADMRKSRVRSGRFSRVAHIGCCAAVPA